MLDNLTAFRELNDKLDDIFLTICRDGLSLGITVVVANSQTSGIGFKYLSNFSTRLAFTCNNSSEYASIFERCRTTPREVPGRAVVEMNKSFYECQMYVPFDAEKEFEKIDQMRSFIKDMNSKYAEFRNSGIIPEVPDVVTKDYVMSIDNRAYGKFDIPVGIKYADVSGARLSLDGVSKVGIAGKNEIGKLAFIRYLTKSVLAMAENKDSELYVVDKVNRELEDIVKGKENVKYTCLADDIKTYLAEISETLKKRYEYMVAGDMEAMEKEPYIVLILNTKDVNDIIDNDRLTYGYYGDIVKKYKNLKVFTILADLENASVNYGMSQVIKSLKDERVLFVFESASEQKVLDMSIQFVRDNNKKPLFGDAFVSDGTDIYKVKTIFEGK